MATLNSSPKSGDARRPSLWFSAFILLIALLPLPFGANRPWASDLFAVLMGTLLLSVLWIERDASLMSGNLPAKRLWASAISLTLVIVWSFIQVAPWTPAAWHHPIWQEAGLLLGPTAGSISIDTGVFPESIVRFAAPIVCFLLAFFGGRNPENARRFVAALALAGGAYAFYGIAAESAGTDTILWYKKWAYTGFVTSTFVNKNSYASYAGLGLLCAIVYVWQSFKTIRPRDQVLARKSRVAAFLVTLDFKDYARLLLPLILMAALVLSGSRGGVISTALGLAGFLAAMALHKKWQARYWLLVGGLGLLLFVALVSLGGNELLLRIGGQTLDEDASTRLTAYNLTLHAIRGNPWLGFGLGTFDSAFRLYSDVSLPVWFHHAHNDYLEMMMDLGVPAALLIFLSLALMVSCAVSGLIKRRKDGVYPALAIGASVLLGVHAFMDFSMHIPAIAATYAALLGLGVAQSWSRRDEQRYGGGPL